MLELLCGTSPARVPPAVCLSARASFETLYRRTYHRCLIGRASKQDYFQACLLAPCIRERGVSVRRRALAQSWQSHTKMCGASAQKKALTWLAISIAAST